MRHLASISAVLCALFACAQEADHKSEQMFFGLGIGIDHGGLGLRLDGLATPHVGIFFGAGYNLATVGWNAGLIYRMRVTRRTQPYATGMYGYNLAIRSTDMNGRYASGTNHFGPSFGGGVELWSTDNGGFFHVGLLVPIRSEEAMSDAEYADPAPWPVLVSFGAHF